jgi:pimeloyl-ACP methyl ester carboxylesterase
VLDQLCHEWVSVIVEKQPVGWHEVGDVPTTYVRLLRDRQLKPARQAEMARRLGERCALVEIDAGHDVMLEHPRELASVLAGLA